MGETQTTEQAPKDLELTFSMPDPAEWTIEHYIMYSEGRKKTPDSSPEIIKRYYGCLELIRRGVVRASGPDKLLAILKDTEQKTTNLPLVGAVVVGVSYSIENAFYIDPN